MQIATDIIDDNSSSLRARAFYFCLGFLSTGMSIAIAFLFLAEVFNACEIFNTEVFWETLLSFGTVSGIVGVLFGDLTKSIQPFSRFRWIWISLVLPIITSFYGLAALTLSLLPVDNLELKDLVSGSIEPLRDYGTIALGQGLIFIVVISGLKATASLLKWAWRRRHTRTHA